MTLEEDLKRFIRDLGEVTFTIWGITPDDHDIKDGEFPINERLARVKGFEAALGAAQSLLAGDPTLMGIFIEPGMRLDQTRYFSRLRVNRAAGQDPNLPHLDPTEGDGPKKGTIIL
jgi:hypothetical protein